MDISKHFLNTFVVRDRHPLLLIEKSFLLRLCSAPFARQPNNLRPTLHEAVVAERFLCALLALANCVEPIRELTSGFSLAAKLPN